ncbi:T9SS sorting signal type C domain-containing protein [Subsaxibacter sp. CAU 1640]|uniref:GEVED domain-containing protein n=1 Tax=Subsaxibacter sp. CAU 1640 TaxID=2933271 RepID=UPI0020049FE1|nr:GEVED domain-containing protein [Subsaxibacter sp. CAU 1640]MCK7588990.1 T9SS sorting signal type C domain-containing protein [Subsaxibacter sp. CAU 1640]
MTKKILSLFTLLLSCIGFAQTVTVNTTGAGSFTVPAGVTSLNLQAWGGGGAGGGTNSNNARGGGGGAGGTYAGLTLAVTPGQNINYFVGAGGAGGSGDGADGEATWFNSVGTLYAQGGAGGTAPNGGTVAGGLGSTAASIGTTLIAGGNGGNGTTTVGGAGGNGGNGGGNGGAQRTSEANGAPGAQPGGGGSGAFIPDNTNHTGGNGGNGRLVITYTVNTAPPNNLCANATTLTCSTTNLAGTTVGTTNQASGTGCSYSNYGVWYTFVGDGNQTTISSTAAAGFDHALSIARGSCGALVNLACRDSAGTAGTESYTFITTNGTTYYIYVSYWGSSAVTGAFTISRSCTTVTPPPNDNICSATPATVNADLLCGAVTPGTVEFATNSGYLSCVTGTPDDDVWFSFVATATSHRISLLNISGSDIDLFHAVYSGSCASPALVAGSCSDPNNSVVTGLTPGNTYYVQVYTWTSNPNQNTTFDLCIGTEPVCPTPNPSPGPITFGTITDVTINGSFPAATPAPDNYIVIRSTSATPPTLTNGTTYTTGQTFGAYTVVDTDTNTNFTATGLTQTTTYFFYIFSMNNLNCTGGPVYSSPLNGSASTVAPSYCIPSSTSTSDYINNFSTSGGVTNINHVNSGFSPGGYGNFTAQSVSQYPGNTINFTMTFVGGTFATRIWVDWNNDLDFLDANELVYNSGGYSNPTNGSFNVLAAAAPGNYRMRVRSDWSNTTVSSCGFDDRSETHDYTLVVSTLNCTANPLSLMAAATSPTTATVSWTAPSPPPAGGYQYIISTDNSTSTPAGDITGITAGTSLSLTGLAVGTTYYVFVRGYCNATDQGVWITTTFTTGCTSIVNTPTVCPIIIDEQGNNPFTANPFVADPTASFGCTTASVTLVANSNLRETTSYIVEQITYPSPAPNYNFPLLGGTAQAITDDDVWADSRTNIGFNFCFYGNTYTQALVGANGMLTFNPGITPGSGAGYAFSNDLPSLANALFEQTIYGVYHDIDPRGIVGTPIKSRVVGTAGCRQFQVSWNDIPMFGDSTRLYTGMIVLHETTNIIEVFIKEKRIENGNVNPWNGGNAIVGLQGDITPLAPNNQWIVAPCRNALDTNWETTNEAWRFTPNGAVINPTSVTWYEGSIAPGNVVASNPDNSLTVNLGGTYFAEVTYNNLCGVNTTLTDEIVVTDGRKQWNGSVDNNWYLETNWTPVGVPTATDCVVIPDVSPLTNYPVADAIVAAGTIPTPPSVTGFARSVTVANNASLTINSDTFLVISDWLNVQGTADVLIRDSGSLVQVNEGAPNTNNNTGNIRMQRTVPGGVANNNYVYWSSPVEGFNVDNINTAASELRFEWDPTIDGIHNGTWVSASGPMTVGKGYIVRGLTTPPAPIPANSAQFLGRPSNGIITTPITRGTYNGGPYLAVGGGDTQATNIDDNWNLVGNPYPSAISAPAFLALNAASGSPTIDGTIYLWSHSGTPSAVETDPFYGDYVYNYLGSDYVAYNSMGANPPIFYDNIAAGQSFFVQMLDAAGVTSTVTFNNSMRLGSPSNNNFLRTFERHRIWLDLVDASNEASSTLVGYIEDATNDKDVLFDGHDLSSASLRFYSLLDDGEMTIQGRTLPFNPEDTIPLGFEVPENGNYKVAINTLDGLFSDPAQKIYLEDTYLNIIHDLRSTPYEFISNSGIHNDRFILRYTDATLGTPEEITDAGFNIIGLKDYIKVTSSGTSINTVVVYDILGRILADYKNINSREFKIDLLNQSKGTLIVKATLDNGQQKIKKVVY